MIEQLKVTKDTNIKLKMYNPTTLTQLGICIVKLEHNYHAKYAVSL